MFFFYLRVRVCATAGIISECLNLANKKDPLPPIIKVVEQKVGKLCFISNLNSTAYVTINGIPGKRFVFNYEEDFHLFKLSRDSMLYIVHCI